MKTLGSIYSQDYQRKMKKCHSKHCNTVKSEEYYSRFLREAQKSSINSKSSILLNLADEIYLSPALLARIVIERHLSATKYDGDPPPKTVVTQWMKETSMIDHPILAREVQKCVVADDVYGPIVDSVKQSIGHEYEFLLNQKLAEQKLAHIGEEQLRIQGYDKTPDAKLEVPIAVDGRVVNWIESKASFGDEESHNGYLKDQFWSYWNRFGPGLVIYWFGFIDELDVNTEKGIMLMDHFPTNITTMKPSTLAPPILS